jgi:stigma-specific protein Stig1
MRLWLLLAAVLLAASCKSSSPCMSVPAMNDLLTNATLVRVDVYDGANVHCAGAIADGQAPPILSHTFPGGAAVRLDLPPGQRTIIMTTYSDPAGHLVTGTACTEASLSKGKAACLSLSLVDIGNIGCSSDDACGSVDGGATPRPHCDPRRHQCVQCVSASDCQAGESCSAAGQCAQPCDASGGCPGSSTCCGGFCIDTNSDPLNCGGCGSGCAGGAAALCCGGQCVTGSATVANCGSCGSVCDSSHSMGATCPANSCVYTGCAAGRSDCNQAAPNLDGCECPTPMCCGNGCQPMHLNGIGQSYVEGCMPPGTPGNESTYSLAMATSARAAAPAGTDGNLSCGNGANATNCLTRTSGATCATWCYGKTLAGRVLQAATCSCSTTSSPAWN